MTKAQEHLERAKIFAEGARERARPGQPIALVDTLISSGQLELLEANILATEALFKTITALENLAYPQRVILSPRHEPREMYTRGEPGRPDLEDL